MEGKNKKFRKNSKKQKDDDEDPILKKKIKKNPQTESKIISKEVPKEEYMEQEEEQPIMSEYEKLLRRYKIKKADLTDKPQGSSVRKLPYNEIQQLKTPKIKFVEKENYNSYLNHFEEDFKKLTNKIVEEGTKKIESKASSDLIENFSFVEKGKKNEGQSKSDNDILNNNIKIRNYAMRKEFKRGKTEYASNYFEKLIADKNAQSFIDGEGVADSPLIHKKVCHILKQEEFDHEDLELLKFINEYLDLIYMGNEEDEFLKVLKD